MRDYIIETEKRIDFIRGQLKNARAEGIVFGNSGGKDSALVGILCKKACENTVGVIMPCNSARNYGDDMSDALALAEQFGIETRTVDLTATSKAIKDAIGSLSHRGDRQAAEITATAEINIAPRLRMTTLYAIAASENRLVAGTGNKSEIHMGYFTKWGDGACDFNPIADLTVTEIYEYLKYLNAPQRIIEKKPSAGLFEGQTDEGDMGVTYKAIDEYLKSGKCDPKDMAIIEKYHTATAHKRTLPPTYS